MATLCHRTTRPAAGKAGLARVRFDTYTPGGVMPEHVDVHVSDAASMAIVANGLVSGAGGSAIWREHSPLLQPEYTALENDAPTESTAKRTATIDGKQWSARARRFWCYSLPVAAGLPAGFRIEWEAGGRAQGLLVPIGSEQRIEHAAEREDGIMEGFISNFPLDGWRFCSTLLLASPEDAAFLRGGKGRFPAAQRRLQ